MWPISVTTSLLAWGSGKKKEERKGAAPRADPGQAEGTPAFSARGTLPPAGLGQVAPVLLTAPATEEGGTEPENGENGLIATRKGWAELLRPQPLQAQVMSPQNPQGSQSQHRGLGEQGFAELCLGVPNVNVCVQGPG